MAKKTAPLSSGMVERDWMKECLSSLTGMWPGKGHNIKGTTLPGSPAPQGGKRHFPPGL